MELNYGVFYVEGGCLQLFELYHKQRKARARARAIAVNCRITKRNAEAWTPDRYADGAGEIDVYVMEPENSR